MGRLAWKISGGPCIRSERNRPQSRAPVGAVAAAGTRPFSRTLIERGLKISEVLLSTTSSAIRSVARVIAVAHIYRSANKQTGVPHFDSKYEVEKHIAEIGVHATILAPVAFMENIYFVMEQLAKGTYASALSLGRARAQIAVADIGAAAVRVLEEPARFIGKRFDLAGDELSGSGATGILSRVIGRPFPIFRFRSMSSDSVWARMPSKMYQWFERAGYAVNRAALRREFPDVTFQDFESWGKTQDWSDLHL
jgi:uncharacterized protein YbjT (DUF2867 family)